MKTLKYTLLFIFGLFLVNSCLVDDETKYDLNDDGYNLATFETLTANLSCTADGSEYTFPLKVKLVGPTKDLVTSTISVTATADPSSTAVENVHYKIENPTITLTPDNNFLGLLVVTVLTEGNTPPMDGTPEFDTYKSPILVLKLAATGDQNVTATGKLGNFTLALTPPNPYAGDYDVELLYFHPTAGGTYPTDPYGGVRALEKTLVAVTGRKCETWFAVWDTDLCWITIKSDNSVEFEVWDEWGYDVKLGDPKDPTKISHYDPETGKIYLYYYYEGTGGPRIFWETFTPKN
ncbi:MAG: hypothetical protein JW965_02960 [Bacteroidales bacterium]|nr:hypothetical protein [Bacteroidales bacterium]